MNNPYLKVESATNSPEQMNRRIFGSVASYLATYQNTSNSKANRLDALDAAVRILEHVIMDMNPAIIGDEGAILHYGLSKILTKAKEAYINVNELYDFKNEIGFLKVIL